MPIVAGSEPIVPVMKSTPWFSITGHASTTIVRQQDEQHEHREPGREQQQDEHDDAGDVAVAPRQRGLRRRRGPSGRRRLG